MNDPVVVQVGYPVEELPEERLQDGKGEDRTSRGMMVDYLLGGGGKLARQHQRGSWKWEAYEKIVLCEFKD